MQLILTASDLASMPPRLRQELIDYMASRPEGRFKREARAPSALEGKPTASAEKLAALDHGQALSLLRGVSFGREAQALHDLLRALAYGKDSQAPTPEELLRLLKLKNRQDLGRRLATISRRATAVTQQSAPIARYSRSRAVYVVHPRTRASLRETFGELVRPGVSEEPTWA